MVNSIRGFIPASQIDRFRVENFGDYVNQKLQCLVTEVNPQKRKLVLSRRAVLERELEEKRKALLASLAEGDRHDGVVTKLMDFGAFVDIGGTEGLVHISKLSWDRVTHPKEVLSVGERVKVKIEKVNRDTGKISLSIRDTLEHPWENIGTKYAVHETVRGQVTKIADFGAFVRLEPGIEGLVHISEIAHHRVMRVSNHLKQGDQVEVKILSIDPEKQKLSLSIKATQSAPVKVEKSSQDEIDEPLRESVIPANQQPLRGGTDRRSGGEDIGLNW
jgi:small subunit ribosomal protein S1